MTDKKWGKLPFEILLCIIQYVQLYNSPKSSTSYSFIREAVDDLMACQLVCKGWSRAAQKILYKNVELGTNTPGFVRTITEDAPHLANLVKILSFLPRFVELVDCTRYAESVIANCAQVEALFVTDSETEQLIWPWLLMEDTKLEKLETIGNTSNDGVVNTALFSLLALKLKRTLTSLTLQVVDATNRPLNQFAYPNNLSSNSNISQKFDCVIKRLNTFISLKSLTLTNCYPSTYKILDQIVNDCSPTTKNLTITMLKLLGWNDTQEEHILPNNSITKLHIQSTTMDELSLLYLIRKFKALDVLEINSVHYKLSQANQDGYWGQLSQLCLSMSSFDVMLVSQFGFPIIVEKCTEILWRAECDVRHLKVSFLGRNDPLHPTQILPEQRFSLRIRKYNSKSCEIAISLYYLPGGSKEEALQNIVSWMQLFSPQTMDLENLESCTRYHNMFTNNPNNESRLKPYFDFGCAGDVKQFFTKECNSVNWQAFDSIVSFDSTENLKFCSMVLPNSPPLSSNGSDVQQDTGIRRLEMSQSILYTMAFPEMSKRLPILHELILHTNCYLKENRYSLEIFLPSTQLDLFSLIIAPTCNVNSKTNRRNSYGLHLSNSDHNSDSDPDSDHYYDSDTDYGYSYGYRSSPYHRHSVKQVQKCALENQELLTAMTSNYTLKIETQTKTHISEREQGNIVQRSIDSGVQNAITGTKENFLIWVKFKELKKFKICSNAVAGSEGYEVLE
ncbi:hypothetical protein BD408DRAFT_479686 [Parasitella parasitica]|nr:hypothetical protein BD408DRAFT_479686 [Parasitella parasitica]